MAVEFGWVEASLSVLGGIAIVGFLVGTSAWDYDLAPVVGPAREIVDDEGLSPAPTYGWLRAVGRSNASGLADDLAALRASDPAVTGSAARVGDPAAAVVDRARGRAYDGAPPVIPHAVRPGGPPECLVCHGEGLRFRGLLASPMSHHEAASCTQCHVPAESPVPGAVATVDPRDVPNGFVGLEATVRGPVAWDGAPPQVPHRTVMRERCESCHGRFGRDPMRTPHPERQSCSQCHVGSAALDLRPGLR